MKLIDYNRTYLPALRYQTGINDLTIQDMYSAMVYLINNGTYHAITKPEHYWSKRQFNDFYSKIMSADSDNISNDFVKAVYQTRFDRKFPGFKKELDAKLPQTEDEFEIETNSKSSPENDIEMISDLLLRKDEVYFD